MPTFWRLVRPVVFFMLIAALIPLGAIPVAAQDGEDAPVPVVIQGSDELEDLVGALRDAYAEQNPDTDVQIDPRGGQNTGFEALCSGEVDIVMSTSPISDAQISACADNGQDFVETVLAYEAVVLLAAPEAGLTCVAPQAVIDAWVLGAEEDVSWTALGETAPALPVVFYGPDAVFPTATLFAGLVPGGRLREDSTVTENPAALYEAVMAEGSSGLGYMSLAEYEALEVEDKAAPLQLQTEDGDCIDATPSTLATGAYSLARTDYLVVNAESAAQPAVQSFMQFVLADENGVRALAADEGYTLADDGTYEFGLNNVLTGNVGRTFTRPATPVTINATYVGELRFAGTTFLSTLTSTLTRTFTEQYTNADIIETYGGNTEGWQAFCAGEADVLQTTAAPTDADLALCADNGIDPYEVDLGYEAQVVAVPQANDWLECLDSATAAAIFGAGSEDALAPALWSDINTDWPEQDLLLLVPPRRTGETDFFVFNVIGELSFAVRQDMTEDSDAEYRAQGIGNTDNGLTYLWWSDLQDADADVRLVAIDSADGCVVPGAETIADGTYPLSFPVRYYVNQGAFDNGLVRAFLWHLFSEDALDAYANRGYLGLDVDALQFTQREALYDQLADYEAQMAEAAEEAPAEDETSTDAADAPTDEAPADDAANDEPSADTEGEGE